MGAVPNPAFDAFIARVDPELVFVQVLVRRSGEEFELRHVEDRDSPNLSDVPLSELRIIGQFTADRRFRPLRTAPSLRRGWRFRARNRTELESALQHLYPAAVADWFAAHQSNPPVTSYRQFTARQSGMYRVAAELAEPELRAVIEACCTPRFCLKHRFWDWANAHGESGAGKSIVPCLEPCAILLELARRAALMAREEKLELTLAASDAAVIRAALESAVTREWPPVREADFGSPAHPQRVQLALARLNHVLPPGAANERSRPGNV